MMHHDTTFTDLLVCPDCRGQLHRSATDLECSQCGRSYRQTDSGTFDLRLPEVKQVDIKIAVGPTYDRPEPDFGPMRPNPRPEVDFDPAILPVHLSPEMASYIPKPRSTDSLCLDLGCGAGQYRAALEQAGYRWIGFDYQHERAPLWADAHALPFADNTFDFIMSLAVLEHIKSPPVMLREVQRVLKSGGCYFGSVAYLVPFHDWASYFNMTHHGVWTAMEDAGFETEFVYGDKAYLGIRALAHGGLFVGMKRSWAHAIVAPVIWLHRLHWLRKRLRGKARFSEDWQSMLNSGALVYRAFKPLVATAAAA